MVEADRLLGPGRGSGPDVVIAMESSGLHSNGYSLVRHVLLDAGGALDWARRRVPGRTLGASLLEPTRIYAKACLDLAERTNTHAMSHITGGGLAANLERVMPVVDGHDRARHLDLCSRSSTWSAASAGAAGGPGGRR